MRNVYLIADAYEESIELFARIKDLNESIM